MTKWMAHPTLPGQLIEVPDLAVIGHELSGWRITDPPPPPPIPDPEPNTDESAAAKTLDETAVARPDTTDTDGEE